jgi:hypothetical protein
MKLLQKGGVILKSLIYICNIYIVLAGILYSDSAYATLFEFSYTGNTFTNVSGPYSTTDRVTTQFVVDLPTIINLPYMSYLASLQGQLVMTDGVRTLSVNNCLVGGGCLPDPDKFPEFRFDTNASGLPIDWQIAVNSIVGTNSIFTYTFGCVFPQIGPGCDFTAFGENAPTAFVSNNPGTWSVVEVVPEPSTLSLLSTFVLALFAMFPSRPRRAIRKM